MVLNYVYFEEPEYYIKLSQLIKNNEAMTMQEVVLSERIRIEREYGEEIGMEKGMEKGAINMLKKGYSVDIIADLLELSIGQVVKIKAELEDKTK